MPSSSSDDVENRSYSYDDGDERYEGKKTTNDKKGGGYTLNEGFKADQEGKNDNNNKSPSSSSGKKKKKKTSIKETVCVFIACLFFCSLCLAAQLRSKCLPIVFLHRQTAAVDTRIVHFAFLQFFLKKPKTNKQTDQKMKTYVHAVFVLGVYMAYLTIQLTLSSSLHALVYICIHIITTGRTNSTLTDLSAFYKPQIRFGKCAVQLQTRYTFRARFYSS